MCERIKKIIYSSAKEISSQLGSEFIRSLFKYKKFSRKGGNLKVRKKRIFALLLAFVLIFSSLPLSAFADEVTTEVATSEEISSEVTEETSKETNIELDNNTNIEGDNEDLGEVEISMDLKNKLLFLKMH